MNRSNTFLISCRAGGRRSTFSLVDQGGNKEALVYPLECNTHRMSDTKRVKFAYDPEAAEEDEGNDLDLDTIKASRNKPKGLKEFDSEGSDSDEVDPETAHFVENDDSEGESIHSEDFDEREVPLTPFNLREDREEGNFDADGFYTRKQDEEADQDRWMANLTRSDIVKARKAHEQYEALKKSTGKYVEAKGERELYFELADLLVKDDLSVAEVIRQTKKDTSMPRAPLNKNRLKKLQKEQQDNNVAVNSIRGEEDKDKVKIERITELADALMDLGNFSVYDETRRLILQKINK